MSNDNVYDTIGLLILKGLSKEDAIKETERILHSTLPDTVIARGNWDKFEQAYLDNKEGK